MTTGHVHEWKEVDRDENDNRTRTRDECVCGAKRYGCCAKRLDDEAREAWGRIGEQWYRVEES